MRIIILAATLLISASCSSLRSGVDSVVSIFEDPTPTAAQSAPTQYRQAVEKLKAKKFDEALSGFDSFLKANPTSPYSQVAMFNSGLALEGLKRFPEAVEKYRAVIESTTRRAPKLQTLALYQISYAYEALGDDAKTIASLRDAYSRRDFLPLAAATAELPARLASAYARSGNPEAAIQFYSQAESGIVRLRNSSEKHLPEWLPQTYFQMGRLAQGDLTWENLDERMRPIEKGQIYLLQAMEFNHPRWSAEAAGELKRIYEQMVTVLIAPPEKSDDDVLLSRRDSQLRQWEMTEAALEALRKLKAARAPKEKGTSQAIADLFLYLETPEKQFKKILSERRVGEGLTPEAQRRKNAPRGRVVNPDTQLEEKYLEKKKKPAEKTNDDPNL